jgi:hypothetical protein
MDGSDFIWWLIATFHPVSGSHFDCVSGGNSNIHLHYLASTKFP